MSNSTQDDPTVLPDIPSMKQDEPNSSRPERQDESKKYDEIKRLYNPDKVIFDKDKETEVNWKLPPLKLLHEHLSTISSAQSFYVNLNNSRSLASPSSPGPSPPLAPNKRLTGF